MWLLWQHVHHSKVFPDVSFIIRFNSCKAEQPLQGMKLQEKEEKDKKQTGKLLRKNLRNFIKVL